MKKKVYTVVVIETTGGRANRDKITEIAIIRHDGEKVIDSFETLINPERTIPYNITQITGITDEMVMDAPKFYEVAKTIVEMTEDAVFVAHNVRFDYTFLREEFRRLGFTFTRKQLCTVRLTRQTFPGLRSYSLGNLIRHFGIEVQQRHRAMADTKATVQLLEMALLQKESKERVNEMVNLGIKESQLPLNISLEKLHELPEECGVYYFHDINGDLVYIGKSINIKKRVMEHFAKKTRKAELLQKSVHDISFEVTGSELIALLQESHEIKYYHPYVNRAQRARNFQHALYSYTNEEGYICLHHKKVTAKERKNLRILHSYPNQLSAKTAVTRLAEKYELCRSFCHLDNTGRPCFYYHIHKCMGACIGEESPEEYNAKVNEAIQLLAIDFDEDFIIMDEGRRLNERSIVLVEDGKYRGFGYIDQENINGNIELLKDAVKPYTHNPDVVRIILGFLNRKTNLEVINLSQ